MLSWKIINWRECYLIIEVRSGQFYTPRCIVQLLVEMLEPYKGRVFDPCCGSGGMFVQSEKFAEAHGGRIGDISVYGQESNQTTWRLCKMNLAIRGIDANIKWNSEGGFLNDVHKDLKADFVIANPPFNDSDWECDIRKAIVEADIVDCMVALPSQIFYNTKGLNMSCEVRLNLEILI